MRSDDKCAQLGKQAAGGPPHPYQALPRIGRSRIVMSEYRQVVVTYSTADDTVYVFCPRGEDPATVLAAARLVLHDKGYRELARYLGVAQLERAG